MPTTKTNKHQREAAILAELIDNHGYRIAPASFRRSSRYTTLINFKTGATRSMYMLTLAVPVNSMLGQAMIASDKANAASKPRPRRGK